MWGKGFSENRGFSLFSPAFSFKLPFSSPGGSQAPGLWARLQSHLTLAAWLSFTSLWNRGQRHRLSDGWQGRPGCGSRARCPLLAGAALDPRPERAPHVPPVTAALRINGEPSFRCAHEAAGGLQASRVVWGGRVGSTHQMPGHSKTRSALIL